MRPSSGRTRSAAMDIAGNFEGNHVWDLCCGSGAFGIECLSAGAAGCSFVDSDRGAVRFVRETLSSLGALGRALLVCGDVTSTDLSGLARPSLVFIDPPYTSTGVYSWAFGLDWGSIASPGGIVMVEVPSGLETDGSWERRRYGETTLAWRWMR
ncbi:MAG TPA: RsmD family RNA methyltransferase, partial [Candidatus Fermentibacter sp.]|nr:RsmD family RNA methyltransferase [Candidatus Fermentibacter sp.]